MLRSVKYAGYLCILCVLGISLLIAKTTYSQDCATGTIGGFTGGVLTPVVCTNCTPPITVDICGGDTDMGGCNLNPPKPCSQFTPTPTPAPTPTPCTQPPKPPEPCDPNYPVSKKWEWIECQWQCVALSDDGGGGHAGCPPCQSNEECDPLTGQCYFISPIILDVDGDGFDLTDAANGVLFDFNGDGRKEQLSWTSANSDEAFLILDRNGNGVVDNGRELFGNFTPQSTPLSRNSNGFEALAEYDKPTNGGNSDGRINWRDAVFPLLRLWQDANHNGVSESNELHALPELGLAILDLDYKESRRTDKYGNWFRYRAKVRDIRGAQFGRWAWDVFIYRHVP